MCVPYKDIIDDNLLDLVLSFHNMDPETETQVVRLGGRSLYRLIHLAGTILNSYRTVELKRNIFSGLLWKLRGGMILPRFSLFILSKNTRYKPCIYTVYIDVLCREICYVLVVFSFLNGVSLCKTEIDLDLGLTVYSRLDSNLH